jgi:hypothetical protein
MKAKSLTHWTRATCAILGLGLVSLSTGCQVSTGGQTLPSPWYYTDDVQYFPPGPEFKLSREAAAMKQYEAERASRERF